MNGLNHFEPGVIVDGRYEIICHIGDGGMGSVYKAMETELKRPVAIKAIHGLFLSDHEHRARFHRESALLSKVCHQGLVKVYRYGFHHDIPFIVMELLDGLSLRQVLEAQTSLPASRALNIGMQVCRTMHEVHKHNIVHRDIKPENIFLCDSPEPDTVKILDFGVARLIDNPDGQQLTRTGALIGSLFYMSPEQCQGKKTDTRGDIYAIGCLLYEALTGRPPFNGDNPIALINQHVTAEPEPLSAHLPSSQIPAGLELVMSKALAKAPQDRYQSVDHMLADLASVHENRGAMLKIDCNGRRKPISARWKIPALAAAAFVLPLLVVLLLSRQTHNTGDPTLIAEGKASQRIYATNPSVLLKNRRQCLNKYPRFEDRRDLYLRAIETFNERDPLLAGMAHYWMAKEVPSRARGVVAKHHATEAETIFKGYMDNWKGTPRSLDPEYGRYCALIVDLMCDRGAHEEAVALVNDYLKNGKGSPLVEAQLLETQGNLYFVMHRYAAAERSYRGYLELEPYLDEGSYRIARSNIAISRLAYCLIRQNRRDEANETINAALGRVPENPKSSGAEWREEVAGVLLELGRAKEAIAICSAPNEAHLPGRVSLAIIRANCLQAAGRSREGYESLKEEILRHPQEAWEAEALPVLWAMALQQGLEADALAVYKKCSSRAPSGPISLRSTYAMACKASLEKRRELLKELCTIFQSRLEVTSDEEYRQVLWMPASLGEHLIVRELYTEAEPLLQNAVDRQSRMVLSQQGFCYAVALMHLGTVQLRTYQNDKARANAKAAARILLNANTDNWTEDRQNYLLAAAKLSALTGLDAEFRGLLKRLDSVCTKQSDRERLKRGIQECHSILKQQGGAQARTGKTR